MIEPKRILFIRRDNIGDLVCTMPLFAALRARYPKAHIALLANTYCAPIVAGNPDLDHIYIYAKAKHLPPMHRPGAYWARIRLVRELRAAHFDYVVLAAASYYARGLEFARWLPNAQVVGFASDSGKRDGIDIALGRDQGPRETEKAHSLPHTLNISDPPPASRLALAPKAIVASHDGLAAYGYKQAIGVHISVRVDKNSWRAGTLCGPDSQKRDAWL